MGKVKYKNTHGKQNPETKGSQKIFNRIWSFLQNQQEAYIPLTITLTMGMSIKVSFKSPKTALHGVLALATQCVSDDS